ncbi:MAG: PotD/PotF family extracellular solute-binding protein [Candidatus Competibacterales bacterium]
MTLLRHSLPGLAAAWLGLVSVFGLATSFAADELNALVWCDHTDPALLDPFEERFDVRVNVREYEGTGTALAMLEQSRPGDWDVFVVDSVDVPRVVAAGLLAPLPEDEFPWQDVFEAVRERPLHFKDGVMYAFPEKFGYNTLAFNRERVDEAAVTDAAIMWDEAYGGRVAIYDYYVPIMSMVAIALGMTPQDISAETLPAIRDKLFAMKDLAALVGDVVQVQTALATGDVDIVVGGGEFAVAALKAEKPALDWVLPEQGGVRWMQAIGVMADSRRKELAMEFIKYIGSPEGQARLATSACYWAMPANAKAGEHLSEAQRDTLRWDQQADYLAKSHPYFVPDPELDAQLLDVWTEFLQR